MFTLFVAVVAVFAFVVLFANGIVWLDEGPQGLSQGVGSLLFLLCFSAVYVGQLAVDYHFSDELPSLYFYYLELIVGFLLTVWLKKKNWLRKLEIIRFVLP